MGIEGIRHGKSEAGSPAEIERYLRVFGNADRIRTSVLI